MKLQKLIHILIGIACIGFLPKAQAVSPAPDGGYGGQNTAEGTDALFSLTSGVWNAAVGFQALHGDTTGTQNTAIGYRALFLNTTGSKSTAYGSQALYNNATGSNNVATGFSTLFSNISGNNNTGNGYRALLFNNGNDNTAIGFNALFNNRTGDDNTATGSQALLHNGSGSANTATGESALFSNTTGYFNTAMGNQALYSTLGGSHNTAMGESALYSNVFGVHNTAVGWAAGYSVAGDGNVCIGSGAAGVPGESGTIRIGGESSGQNACYISGIYAQSVDPGTSQSALIDANGKLGTAASSRRFKRDIKAMEKTSETILALKPVTFHYKSDAKNTPCFGLIAEDVAEVAPNLVVRDKGGEILSVRYDQVNAMLLNEFLKEHKAFIEEQRKVQEQETTITQLKQDFQSRLAHQQKQIEALTTGLQKVSDQLELSKPAPRTVGNNQ
jgi:trimeric autotransporter adhesin